VSSNPHDDGVVAVKDFQGLARAVVPEHLWNYLSDGAGEQQSLIENELAWQEPWFVPKVMAGLSEVDTSISLLGRTLEHPILFAPTAMAKSYHPEGEAATMRAAVRTSTTYIQSALSGVPLDELGAIASQGSGSWWYQVYLHRDRSLTQSLVESAIAAGAQAVVLTVDSPTLGARDNDRRHDWGQMPDDGIAIHQRVFNPMLDSDFSWKDLEWLRALAADVPVWVKGILRADDAIAALDHGAVGVMVSNHGARNLDTIIPTAVALPRIVDAVASRAPIIVDGGIRRGTDIVRALALGADAVMIGRPYIWALASHGEDGVAYVAEVLRAELAMAMALVGVGSIKDLSTDILWD
jgi:4-hydroxymandelate oxidase